jgi:hypothetical protein
VFIVCLDKRIVMQAVVVVTKDSENLKVTMVMSIHAVSFRLAL